MIQKYLTIEEVQNFQNLGLNFKETGKYWCIGSNGYKSKLPTDKDVIEEAISVTKSKKRI